MNIKSKRIDNFLYCCQLETGGCVLGWLGVIGSILSVVVCILVAVGLWTYTVSDEDLHRMGFGNPDDNDQYAMNVTRTIFGCIMILCVVLSLVLLVISIFLIRGTKTRNPRHVLPAVFYYAISAFLSLFGLYYFSVSSVMNVVYYIYGAIVIYSLWRKFQEESDDSKGSEAAASPATVEHDVI